MKKTLTHLTTIIALCATPTLVAAGPKGHGNGKKGHNHRKANVTERIADNAAAREEALLDKIDTHAWKKDPEARDHRSSNLRDYTNYSFRRIVRLLTMGALEEADGRKLKNSHTAIVTAAKAANKDGLDDTEKSEIRTKLNTLNDEINASIKEPEQDDKRTPIVNRAQHRFEELIEFGVRSGRLSTLEASSLRRKVKRLEATENRLKAGDLSSNERERLMKEVVELNRDIKKELRD
ncbi:MAG: hypothetical protein AB8F34_06020 [Akkermansiaceae bacterium]